jgi:hypothetical protein
VDVGDLAREIANLKTLVGNLVAPVNAVLAKVDAVEKSAAELVSPKYWETKRIDSHYVVGAGARVLGALMEEYKVDGRDGDMWISYQAFARRWGMEREKVRGAVSALQRRGLLKKVEVRSGYEGAVRLRLSQSVLDTYLGSCPTMSHM